jgi:hypothetical protein
MQRSPGVVERVEATQQAEEDTTTPGVLESETTPKPASIIYRVLKARMAENPLAGC